MSNVFFDGDYLCVEINRKNAETVLQIAEGADYFQYTGGRFMLLPPTKRIANKLYNARLSFDESALIFVKKKSKKKVFLFDPSLELRPYQEKGVEWMLNKNTNFLLADQMGLGKTIQIAAYLHIKKEYPVLIICPSSLKLNWERELKKWTGQKCLVLDGLTAYAIEPLLQEYPIVIINYDILGRKNRNVGKSGSVTGWVDVLKKIDFSFIICDESQYIGDPKTARTQSVMGICKKSNSSFIALSGTPYTSATAQFFTTLHLINRSVFPSRWQFLMQYCNPKKARFGWEFKGLSNGEELNEKIKPLMLRRLKKDVLLELPAKEKIVVPMELNSSKYKRYLNNEEVMFNAKKVDYQKTYHELKKEAFFAKENSCMAWIREYIDCNDKLVVFCYHREVFHKVLSAFGKQAVGVNGETLSGKRLEIVDNFQKNSKIKLFVGQIRAAGVGITLTAASAAAFIEFGDTAAEHEQAEDRIHRIGQEAENVTAYYLMADRTIEASIMKRLQKGYENQKQVLDGKVSADFISGNEFDFAKEIIADRRENVKKCL